MSATQTFAFESDFVASLRCVPMAVRFKLDQCGVKLTLRQWSRFTRDDRQALLDAPCDSAEAVDAYRAMLVDLIQRRAGEAARWLAEPATALQAPRDRIAPAVASYARKVGVAPPTDGAWQALTQLERFALVKLSRDNHDNVNFLPAMREFGLL